MLNNDCWSAILPYLTVKEKKAWNLTCRAFYKSNHIKVSVIHPFDSRLHPYLTHVKEALFTIFTPEKLRPIASSLTHITLKSLVGFSNCLSSIPQLLSLSFHGNAADFEPLLPDLKLNCPHLNSLHIFSKDKGIVDLPLFPDLQNLTIPLSAVSNLSSITNHKRLKNITVILLNIDLVPLINFPCHYRIACNFSEIFTWKAEEASKLKKARKYEAPYAYLIVDCIYPPNYLEQLNFCLNNDFYYKKTPHCISYFWLLDSSYTARFFERMPEILLKNNLTLTEVQLNYIFDQLQSHKLTPEIPYYHALVKHAFLNNEQLTVGKFLRNREVMEALKTPFRNNETIFHVLAREGYNINIVQYAPYANDFLLLLEANGILLSSENIFGENAFEIAVKEENWQFAHKLAEQLPSLLRFKTWKYIYKVGGKDFVKAYSNFLPFQDPDSKLTVYHIILNRLLEKPSFEQDIFFFLELYPETKSLFFREDDNGFTPYALATNRLSKQSMKHLNSLLR